MAMMSVQFPVEDSLWNNAANAFKEQGTNIFDAIKDFLKNKVADTPLTVKAKNRKAFKEVWSALCSTVVPADMTTEEINDEIDLCRTERWAKASDFALPDTIPLPGGSYILSAPENCTTGWLSQFHRLYNNEATSALQALNHAGELARAGAVPLSDDEINAEIAAYRAGR